MRLRLVLLVSLFTALVAVDPPWILVDWSDPLGWIRTVPAVDAVAALLRAACIGLAGTQLTGVILVGAGQVTRSGAIARIGRRMLIPVVRGAAPVLVVAGTALPAAAATGTRLPITPPVAATEVQTANGHAERTRSAVRLPVDHRTVGRHVVVQAGDSMWTIAADHADGEVGVYWARLVESNRPYFADVNLIHPGDVVRLPDLTSGG